MTRVQTQPMKSGITQQQFNLFMQIVALNDVASELKVLCSWYDDPDPQYGGVPSKEILESLAKRLSLTHDRILRLTEQDRLEKLDSTKAKLQALRSDRWAD